MKPPSGVIGETALRFSGLRLADVDAAKPVEPAQPTPANLHVYEFDWSPDSKGLAYVAANPPGENNWWVAKLYTQTLDGAPKRFWRRPRYPGRCTDCRLRCLGGRRTAAMRLSAD